MLRGNVRRTVSFVHHPDDFPDAWLRGKERKLLDLYLPAAEKSGLGFEFVPARELVPAVGRRPHLYRAERDLLEERGCFLLEQTSADPQAAQFLGAIYEVVAASDSVLVNRTTTDLEFLERDKLAIADRAGALGVPHLPTLVVPPGRHAQRVLRHLPLLGDGPWLLKPREMSMGRAVLRFSSEEELRSGLDLVAQSGSSYVLQPYLVNEGDLRVYLIDGVVSGAQLRRPAAGGLLANTSRGGHVSTFDVPAELGDWCRRITDSLGARYLCVDWLVTGTGFVLNEWCTTLGGFSFLPSPQREERADALFAFIAREIERAESPQRQTVTA